NPGAWLMATAKHRALDHFRRAKLLERKHEELGRELKSQQEAAVADFEFSEQGDIEDDLLRLVFVSCHPVLSTDARVALTLRLLGGLTTTEIARAYLVPEPTIAQRIVRAKRTLSDAKVPFEVPAAQDRATRLSSVIEVIYLIFNEGYSATAGSDWMRPDLCADALRLGRMLAELAPTEAEVHGLVALMEIQSSRFAARTTPDGEPILLLDQNRALWDQLLLRPPRSLPRHARSPPRSPGRICPRRLAHLQRPRTRTPSYSCPKSTTRVGVDERRSLAPALMRQSISRCRNPRATSAACSRSP